LLSTGSNSLQVITFMVTDFSSMRVIMFSIIWNLNISRFFFHIDWIFRTLSKHDMWIAVECATSPALDYLIILSNLMKHCNFTCCLSLQSVDVSRCNHVTSEGLASLIDGHNSLQKISAADSLHVS
jgi:hypothetical protein